jgi:hypothetical protein
MRRVVVGYPDFIQLLLENEVCRSGQGADNGYNHGGGRFPHGYYDVPHLVQCVDEVWNVHGAPGFQQGPCL